MDKAKATLHRKRSEMRLFLLARAASIGCVIALAVLAWAPAQAMARTPLGGHAEHLLAYLGTSMILGLTSRRTPVLATQCLLLTGYAGLLECGQIYAPGRQASFHDFAFSVAGVALGAILAWIARRRWLRSGLGAPR